MRTINRHNLSIANLANKEASRFFIGGIHITPEYTEVTDGHCAMRVSNPDIDSDSFPDIDACRLATGPAMLSTESALKLAKAVSGKVKLPVLGTAALMSNGVLGSDGKAKRYFVATDLETITKVPVETDMGNFPDIDRVLPRSEKMDFSITFDAKLMQAVIDQFVRMGSKKDKVPVTMYFEIPGTNFASQAALMTGSTDDGQSVTAAVMPLRDGSQEFWKAKRGAYLTAGCLPVPLDWHSPGSEPFKPGNAI